MLEAAIAVAVLANGGSGTPVARAAPLHPVAGSFQPDETRLGGCTDQSCFEQAFGNLAYYQGPARALAVFDEIYANDADAGCHRVAHTIGSASLARNGGDIGKTFAQGSSSCFSGYYHGVLERSLVRVKSRTASGLARVARDLCAGAAVESSLWLRFQCLHGLGHGLMITTGYTLPLSLQVCNRLRTAWEEETCNGGVFMENLGTSYGVVSRWLREDDPVYPCNAVPEEDKLKCYELVTSHILRTNDGDWERTAQACTQVEERWEWACFRSLGRDAIDKADDRLEETLELCAAARAHGREKECVTGAAETLVGNYRSGAQASALCKAAPRPTRASCYFGTGTLIVRFLRPEGLRAGCSDIATGEADVSACVRGGRHYLGLVARGR